MPAHWTPCMEGSCQTVRITLLTPGSAIFAPWLSLQNLCWDWHLSQPHSLLIFSPLSEWRHQQGISCYSEQGDSWIQIIKIDLIKFLIYVFVYLFLFPWINFLWNPSFVQKKVHLLKLLKNLDLSQIKTDFILCRILFIKKNKNYTFMSQITQNIICQKLKFNVSRTLKMRNLTQQGSRFHFFLWNTKSSY